MVFLIVILLVLAVFGIAGAFARLVEVFRETQPGLVRYLDGWHPRD